MDQEPVDPSLSLALQRLLRLHYGHESFRPQQLEAIAATITGKDCLLILPTGGGKSITFQLTPLYKNQICVIVTPLLALGKDQVERCLELGIDATLWSSETSEEKKRVITRELQADWEDTSLRLLYTTPESLCRDQLRELLLEAHRLGKISSFAIDEAHCVSEWGHDFRPSYLALGEVRDLFKGVPVIAVTATATQQVRKSLIEQLHLKTPVQLLGSFNRANIEYALRYKELIGDGGKEAVMQDLLAFLSERRGQCGIIYARLRKTCDWLASELQAADIDAAAYHAGKDMQQRSRVQSGWSEGAYSVVVATIAFGMGIDKANVAFVVHWDPPASIEGFYQESGRAGRDGSPSVSLLYASNEELKDAMKMEKGNRQGATAAVAGYIQEAKCRRRALLAYFNERRGPCDLAAGDICCDFCRDPQAVRSQLRQLDKTVEAAAEAAAAAERVAQAAEDPYDRCDAGSGPEAAPHQLDESPGERSSKDGLAHKVANVFKTAKQQEGSGPAARAAARAPGHLPTLGLRRLHPGARPQLPLHKAPAPTPITHTAAPEAAACDAAAAAPGHDGVVSGCSGAPHAFAGPSGNSEPTPPAAAAAGGGAGCGGVSEGLKRLPLKPLLHNRSKRPAEATLKLTSAEAGMPQAEQQPQQQRAIGGLSGEPAEKMEGAEQKSEPAAVVKADSFRDVDHCEVCNQRYNIPARAVDALVAQGVIAAPPRRLLLWRAVSPVLRLASRLLSPFLHVAQGAVAVIVGLDYALTAARMVPYVLLQPSSLAQYLPEWVAAAAVLAVYPTAYARRAEQEAVQLRRLRQAAALYKTFMASSVLTVAALWDHSKAGRVLADPSSSLEALLKAETTQIVDACIVAVCLPTAAALVGASTALLRLRLTPLHPVRDWRSLRASCGRLATFALRFLQETGLQQLLHAGWAAILGSAAVQQVGTWAMGAQAGSGQQRQGLLQDLFGGMAARSGLNAVAPFVP
ncbi:hypothetical protein N2152v2_005353 [Parachlorella kessleri]